MRAGALLRQALTALLLMVFTSLVPIAVGQGTATSAADQPAVAQDCRRDLAERLGLALDHVQVAQVIPVTWPDTALGLPRPGMMYAQVLTAGWGVLLEARDTRYLYTASERSFVYGGPLALWQYSALYIEPVPNEPNLNGNLMQVSLIGTNPTLMLAGVNGFHPQRNGSVIASRRTSRSGHELLYVAPGAGGEGRKLAAAFSFGDATLSPDGEQWVAFRRPFVGAPWTLIGNRIDADAEPIWSVDLPEGALPRRVYREGERLVAALEIAGQAGFYELREADGGRTWDQLNMFVPAETSDMMLNKSETLVAVQETVDGKPSVRVVRQWFTGDENPLATVTGLTLRSLALTPEKRFLLLSGVEDEAQVAYTVDVATGEILPCVRDASGDAGLLLAPPRTWSKLAELLGLESTQ